MNRHFVSAIFLIALLFVPALARAENEAATRPSAREVIESVVHDVLAVLRDSSLSKPEKMTRVRRIADKEIDFTTLARLAMGRFWRGLTDSQRSDFVAAFTEHISATHGRIIGEYSDEDVQVIGDRPESRGDYTVITSIIGTKDGRRQEIAKVEYRLRQFDGRWKIIDVTIDGISMAANFRAQFQEIMSNSGFDQLLKLLREKNVENR